ncbi:Hypothetical protein CGLY_15595 [Corynebacterium glyciniphilum AJ 3170]|uniref:Uncharacterized protein n=1 Tax=Corynebacterium glyciniphilum AJ 3170 TaxID=1404245 RepID=X5EDS3_9CORY|nr:hypothetical protein [Corynebacterium glyciniphilum]AHW65555.1 Hypothetical protein CGLY_15595 [Corynebacterium glyciniphilum AJ 3170]
MNSPTNDGTASYTVNGPIDSPTRHDSADHAATDLTNRITSVQDATEAAHQRAGQWATVQQSAADDNAAWSTLAAEVNAELPHGCNIPTPTANDLYAVASWPPMTAMVADTLARWHATNRDHAARSAPTDAPQR